MYLEILTPESKIFSGEITLVSLPGTLGSFEILNNHAPLISTLGAGSVKVIDTVGQTQLFPIKRGVVECLDNQIHLLVAID
ncbi:MAG: F0F1 ATP synthase subunit epsilon [Bacteroidales bacterium]|nr:F0F1 ATP synthase subunit epsilon [bacterium]